MGRRGYLRRRSSLCPTSCLTLLNVCKLQTFRRDDGPYYIIIIYIIPFSLAIVQLKIAGKLASAAAPPFFRKFLDIPAAP